MKQTMIAGFTASLVLTMAARASDGRITFTGAVVAESCTAKLDDQGSNVVVALPVVDESALGGSSAPATTVAGTYFKMTLSGCGTTVSGLTGQTAPSTVAVYFEAGPNVDEATGGLINEAQGSNVEVKLYYASGSFVVGHQIRPGTPDRQPAPLSIAASAAASQQTQWFYAGYSSAGKVTTGSVNTSVLYTLVYE